MRLKWNSRTPPCYCSRDNSPKSGSRIDRPGISVTLQKPISVLLTTEGTYPFYAGGVSTWCHRLTHGLPDIDFTLLAVVTNPYPPIKHELAPNVQGVIKVPQWGLLQPAEYSNHQPASIVLRNLWDTTRQRISASFKPLFERFIALILSSHCDMEEL